jgi:hypothetical protein
MTTWLQALLPLALIVLAVLVTVAAGTAVGCANGRRAWRGTDDGR